MAMNVSAWSIRTPIPSIVLFTVLMLLGIVTFQSMSITRFPNIDVPVVAVTVTQSGAAPAELETQVAKRIEDAVANLTGVKHVLTTLTDGTASVAIEFRLGIDPAEAVDDVKDAVAKIRQDLPRTIDEPIVEKIDVAGQSLQTYAASAPTKTLEQLSWYVDDVVVRELQGLKGVGRVDRIGGVKREIHVRLDPDRLMALGITAAEVNRQVRATNVNLASSAARSRRSARWPAPAPSRASPTRGSCCRAAARRACPTWARSSTPTRSRGPSRGSTGASRSSPSASSAARGQATSTSPPWSRPGWPRSRRAIPT